MNKSIFVLIFVLLIANLSANDKKTAYSIKGGIYGNINLYNADFQSFSISPMQHSGFSGAAGFDFAAMIGGEYDISKDLFGFDTKYSFELLYTGLRADFSNEDLLGYDIGEDDYESIIADYVIEPKLSAVITEHSLKTYFIKNLPLSVKTGVFIGIPLNTAYTQYTTILNPADIVFENGSKTANEFSGDIPDAASVIAGITIGAGYDIDYFKSFTITPEIKFNYGFSNISTELDWKVNTLQAGISINYTIPKAKVPPPAKPPMPVAPITSPPPAEAVAEIEIEILENDSEIENTIKYNFTEKQYYEKELIIPVVFIEKDVKGYDDNYNPDEILKLTAEKIKNENTKLYITAGYENADEKEQISQIINTLKNYGVKQNQIETEIISIKDKNFKYPELKDEAKSLKFRFENQDDVITKEYLKNTNTDYGDKSITVDIAVTEIDNYDFNAFAVIDNKKIKLNEGNNQINLKEYFDKEKIKDIKIEVQVKDDWNNTFSNEKTVKLIPEKNIQKFENYNPASNKSVFTIGFFEFDSEEIYGVDNNLKSEIKNALANDKKITLIALTDNLGVDYYNKKLALRRADAALKELGLKKENVEIKVKEGGLYNNSNPYGRMLNRSVIIEIK